MRHGNHIGAQRSGRRLGDHRAGSQHFGGIGRRVIVGRQQWAAVAQLLLKPFQPTLLVPLLVVAQAQIVGDLGQRSGMASGILADIQAHQEQAEHGKPTQAIEQGAVGDHAHAAGMQRAVAQFQRSPQLRAILQHVCRRWLAVLDGGPRPVTGRPQALTQWLEQYAVGFRRLPRLA